MNDWLVMSSPTAGTLYDQRDARKYDVIKIGTQLWTAENLNYQAAGSLYYDNDAKHASQLGRLYNWNSAINACPIDWHLPSDDEWKQLEQSLGMDPGASNGVGFRGTTEGTKLKAGGSSGFNALMGGFYDPPMFSSIDFSGGFWTSTESGASAYERFVTTSEARIYRGIANHEKPTGWSVRCVKD